LTEIPFGLASFLPAAAAGIDGEISAAGCVAWRNCCSG
jgi:hypothetical protein